MNTCNLCKIEGETRNFITYTELTRDSTLPPCQALRRVCDSCYGKFVKLKPPVRLFLGYEKEMLDQGEL